jgi:2-polyprenyl-3-methyl-5-hydroxy-6-metoxy-1,4-benzoquinol methylase
VAYTQRQIFQSLSPDSSALILDWGCGRGDQIDTLNTLGYKNVSGLDVDELFSRDDIVIEKDSVGWLEKNAEKWDVILARESIYYITKSEQVRLWRAFNGALRPQGKLVVIAFNGALTSSDWIKQKDHGIEIVFNEISLKSLALTSNFVAIQVGALKSQHRTPIGFLFSGCMSLFRVISNQLRFLSERGLDSNNPRLFTKSIFLEARKI